MTKHRRYLLTPGRSIALGIRLKRLVRRPRQKPEAALAINRREYRVFSQHREDGVIDHLLRKVGGNSRKFVEFGFGPDVCNCLNLAVNHGFEGLFIDGSANKCEVARDAYARLGLRGVSVVEAFLTVENINRTILDAGIGGDIDVLSIDVDGNDYWFWSALTAVSPRIVVIEYNASLGRDRALTVPYDPAFVRYEKHASGFYHGASLLALERLGTRKGYRLVGCDSTGVNAFFVRNDLHAPDIETLDAERAFFPHRGRVRYKKLSEAEQFDPIADMKFVEIDRDGLRSPGEPRRP